MNLLSLDAETTLYFERIGADLPGTPDRPCLVFLHEGLGSTGLWRDFPARLCALTGCPGLSYDRQGYGRSSPLTRPRSVHYLHHYALGELPAVLARLIPEQDYLVIGHSDGGSIGLLHAAEQPLRLRGLITEAAHVFVEAETLAGIRAADDAYAAGKLQGLKRHHGDKSEALFRAWADIWQSPGFKAWNIEYALPSITCPLLAIQGRDDQYGSAAQLDAIVGPLPQAEKATVEACGHTPHHEQQEIVLGLMAAYVRRVARPGPASGRSAPAAPQARPSR